jgi:hypothetical protein
MKKFLLFLATLAGLHAAHAQTACNADFTITQTSVTPFSVSVHNTSTMGSGAGATYYSTGYVSFGDGSNPVSSYVGNNTAHNYSGPGTYHIWLSQKVIDSLTSQVICIDTFSQNFTVTQNPASTSSLSGTIHYDPNAITDSVAYFKVWLIQHDVSANTLTALATQSVYPWNLQYSFPGVATGDYLVKVSPDYGNATLPAYGYVPTYHDSTLYWNTAVTISHNGTVATTGQDVWMQLGTPTSGPGFVGGNISSGAGKGTGTGVEGMLVFLRNSTNNKMVASAYTDENGNYTFTNIGTGTYNVYPEDMNYATTPSAVLSITSGQTNNTGIDFEQTEDQILPKTTLGIDPLTKNDALSVYPNPVNDILSIDNKNGSFAQLTVVNTLGQVVKQTGIKKGMNKIGMETLRSGIYYIVVKGADGARSMKITRK